MFDIVSPSLWQDGAGAIVVLATAVPLYRTRGWPTTTVVSLLLAAAIVYASYAYRATTQLSPIAEAVTPAWIQMVQSHAATRWQVEPLQSFPAAIQWYRLAGRDLTPDGDAPPLARQPAQALYYLSSLRGDDAWTALFLWRTGIVPRLSLAGKHALALVLEAQEPDYLEIGLKDTHGIETKIRLPVAKGWAGYRIPLDAFVGVDTRSLQLVMLAHTRAVGSRDSNVFKIALVGAL